MYTTPHDPAPLATRVPKETEEELREITDFLKVEKAEAVRIILKIGIAEWKKRMALELLREGKVTFAKAAKLAGLDVWEFADTVREKRIEWVRLPVAELQEEARKAAVGKSE